MQSTTIIAFDQHAATTMAAVLLPGHRTPALHPLTSDAATIGRFVTRFQRHGAVRCCYEAGPCGFELQRTLTAQHVPCEVIAPALIPRRPGDRVKTDRRDAGQLAVLYRADALTAIHIPPIRKKPRATCYAAGKTSVLISSGFAIVWPNSCSDMGGASPAQKRRGRSAITRGCARKRGHCRHSRRRTRPISAPLTRRWPACGPSRRTCAGS